MIRFFGGGTIFSFLNTPPPTVSKRVVWGKEDPQIKKNSKKINNGVRRKGGRRRAACVAIGLKDVARACSAGFTAAVVDAATRRAVPHVLACARHVAGCVRRACRRARRRRDAVAPAATPRRRGCPTAHRLHGDGGRANKVHAGGRRRQHGAALRAFARGMPHPCHGVAAGAVSFLLHFRRRFALVRRRRRRCAAR